MAASDRYVLIVEDDTLIRELVRTLIEGELGVSAVMVRDGQTALEQAGRTRPDLVLLDMKLPGVSGLDVTRRLKADPATECVPVVAMSGAEPSLRAAREAGADECLVKPFDVDTFVEKVGRLLVRAAVE